MSENPRIPILILEDARRRSCLSLEPSPQTDGTLRLFKEFSGTAMPSGDSHFRHLEDFIASFNPSRIYFEDTRKSTVRKMMRKAGFRKAGPYDYPKGIKVKWRARNSADIPETALFGVDAEAETSPGNSARRLFLAGKDGPIGEMVFSDHGRFVRAKANRHGSDGYGRVIPGKDPSILLLALSKEMLAEGKRYMILGPEYGDFSEPVHPFPLWHMTLHSPRKSGNNCRFADQSDVPALVRLTSEYEDVEPGAAYLAIAKNMQNKSFRYIVDKGSEGFALVKFMDAAEGMINDLFVSPGSQGRGIGDNLTRASIDALSDNCLNVHLNTIYPRAKRLYEKHGFKVVYQDFCVALRQSCMTPPA